MIQKILGCLNCSSDFIKDLDKERKELQKLLTKKKQTGWNEKHTMIVKRLKNICSNLPKLRLPNENENLILQTDALDKYWAAILKTDLGENVDIQVEPLIIIKLIMILMKKNYLQ